MITQYLKSKYLLFVFVAGPCLVMAQQRRRTYIDSLRTVVIEKRAQAEDQLMASRSKRDVFRRDSIRRETSGNQVVKSRFERLRSGRGRNAGLIVYLQTVRFHRTHFWNIMLRGNLSPAADMNGTLSITFDDGSTVVLSSAGSSPPEKDTVRYNRSKTAAFSSQVISYSLPGRLLSKLLAQKIDSLKIIYGSIVMICPLNEKESTMIKNAILSTR